MHTTIVLTNTEFRGEAVFSQILLRTAMRISHFSWNSRRYFDKKVMRHAVSETIFREFNCSKSHSSHLFASDSHSPSIPRFQLSFSPTANLSSFFIYSRVFFSLVRLILNSFKVPRWSSQISYVITSPTTTAAAAAKNKPIEKKSRNGTTLNKASIEK